MGGSIFEFCDRRRRSAVAAGVGRSVCRKTLQHGVANEPFSGSFRPNFECWPNIVGPFSSSEMTSTMMSFGDVWRVMRFGSF